MNDFEKLINSVSQRRPKKKGGAIIPASAYMLPLSGCFGDNCALAATAKKGERQLTYRNSDMIVLNSTPQSTTPGSIMDFDFVLTATDSGEKGGYDRDGDILESAGANVDPRCPLLWQHLPNEPIGRLVQVLSQNTEMVTARASIADVALGRDAVELISMGALRISHGFKPRRFEPIRPTKDNPNAGFHIFEFDVLEVSTVSVPSNSSAIITSFSRNKLTHPFTKAWAQGLRDRLPIMVKGGWIKEQKPCDGKCVRHLAKRFRGKLKRGKYPKPSTLKAVAKVVKKALQSAVGKEAVNVLAKHIPPALLKDMPDCKPTPSGVPSCICTTYDRKSRTGPNKMARMLMGALAFGKVHLKTLASLHAAMKRAKKALRRKSAPTTATAAQNIDRASRECWLTSTHEAGHAVLALLLGDAKLAAVAVGSGVKDKTNRGEVLYKQTSGAIDRREKVAIRLAGFAAERWATGNLQSMVGQSDISRAAKQVKKLTGSVPNPEAINNLIEKLANLFTNPAIHDATKRLAAEVAGVVGGKVEGWRAEQVVREAIGDRWDDAAKAARDSASGLVRV